MLRLLRLLSRSRSVSRLPIQLMRVLPRRDVRLVRHLFAVLRMDVDIPVPVHVRVRTRRHRPELRPLIRHRLPMSLRVSMYVAGLLALARIRRSVVVMRRRRRHIRVRVWMRLLLRVLVLGRSLGVYPAVHRYLVRVFLRLLLLRRSRGRRGRWRRERLGPLDGLVVRLRMLERTVVLVSGLRVLLHLLVLLRLRLGAARARQGDGGVLDGGVHVRLSLGLGLSLNMVPLLVLLRLRILFCVRLLVLCLQVLMMLLLWVLLQWYLYLLRLDLYVQLWLLQPESDHTRPNRGTTGIHRLRLGDLRVQLALKRAQLRHQPRVHRGQVRRVKARERLRRPRAPLTLPLPL